jgi:glycosyltransferase involved in cell wall biosynthesis
MRFASGIVCLSREMASMLAERLPESVRGRIWQHFNAVDMEAIGGMPWGWNRMAFRQAAGWRDEAVVAVVAAFVDGRKRQAELVKAFARNPDPRLHVAIVGPSKDAACWDACQRTVATHGLSVTFHGYQADIAPWYRAADIVALPSSAEGIPRVVLEGAAAGLPAVAFDIPGCREALVDGKTGFLANSMDSFLQALSTLAGSADLRRSMGEAGRNYVVEHFEARRNIERLEGLYRDFEANG